MSDGGLRDFLQKLEDERDAAHQRGEAIVLAARSENRAQLNAQESRDFKQALADKKALSLRVAQTRRELERTGVDNPLLQGIRSKEKAMSSTPNIHVLEKATYQAGDHRCSYVQDLVRVQLGMGDVDASRQRLNRHAQDVAEYRAIDRTDSSAGYFVPPLWLVSQWIKLARPGRAFANTCTIAPLPAGTDNISVPKLLTGTTTAFQSADNTPVSNTDLTDTFVNAPVKTIAGEQDVALQLIDQSPVAFDEVVFQDLTASHAATLDAGVIYADGTNNTITGITNVTGIQTVTVAANNLAASYAAIANAIQLVHTTRFLPPTAIFMHPRRWGWFLSLLDNNQRPLFLPQANGLMNAAGVLENVESQQVVGQVQGVPVITDPNIPITLNGNQDPIFVARMSDLMLWESGIRARVLPQTLGQQLTIALQVYSYLAFASRYPQSFVQILGLTTPSFSGS
ncbi:phage major capsid protein [Mycobacterium sp.]|uniref:phage major capsid protein n=1 Tax=Mycobacterium sp. TaxID=1785 RepID=UPI003F9A7461